ncbi:adenine nucleotide alpha hydrolase family protein [Streptomyces swartbergensis]|uniref:hypothetical protein n=1 Tax=Streptomyces swartbergensis TaxID=487165 RepID=UPI00382A1109
MAVYISRSDGLTAASPKELAVQRTLVEDLGGTFHQVVGEDIPAALLDFARGVNATQIVLGVSRRKGWQYVFGPGVGATVARDSGPDLDVHLMTRRARDADCPCRAEHAWDAPGSSGAGSSACWAPRSSPGSSRVPPRMSASPTTCCSS